MRVTATDAKNRFGRLCSEAKREPVFVQKAGRLDTVILSMEQYQALCAGQTRAPVQQAKAVFETEFRDWIQAQHEWVDAHGVPGSDLRPW
ncbi:MAG: prevent-host-death protein [Burkholderiaceae bacterium]|nr:prevent-host-death protein [Burkholderiaceae bacterium]